MIERNDHELSGQFELTDFLTEGTGNREQGTGVAEGYDAEGRLLNEDWPSTTVGAAQRPPVEMQTPAPSASARLTALAGEIAAITQHARVVLASAAIDIGKRLIEAQGLVPDGRWSEWLEKNVDYSQRQAQVFMQLADQFGRGELPEAYQGLGISHMTALLAAPAEAREDMAQRVKDEDLSVRELKKEIEALKIEKVKGQMKIDALTDQYETAKRNIEQMDAEDQKQAQAIMDLRRELADTQAALTETEAARNRAYEESLAAVKREREAAQLAQAKAAAAEASAEELRKLHSDAEDRAAASAQRASDAVNRANQTAKDLSAARAEIARLEAEKAALPEPEPRTVEVVPEDVARELEALRAKVASAAAKGTGNREQGTGEAATASEKFKWFYANQMKPAFTTALSLLREVAQEDAHAADLFATALTKGCQQLMGQLGIRNEE